MTRSRAFWPGDCRTGNEGFAAIDALVALTILAATISLSLVAGHTARRAALTALEVRRANDLMNYVMVATPHAMGDQQGRAVGFAWNVTTVASSNSGAGSVAPICTRSVEAISLASRKTYRFETNDICPPRALTAAPAS